MAGVRHQHWPGVLIVDLFDVDPLISADVELVFLEAAKADRSFAEAARAFNALPAEGGE